jgi:hypothetical protein
MEYGDILSYIELLEKRIHILEQENVGTTNLLYEFENRLEALENEFRN